MPSQPRKASAALSSSVILRRGEIDLGHIPGEAGELGDEGRRLGRDEPEDPARIVRRVVVRVGGGELRLADPALPGERRHYRRPLLRLEQLMQLPDQPLPADEVRPSRHIEQAARRLLR